MATSPQLLLVTRVPVLPEQWSEAARLWTEDPFPQAVRYLSRPSATLLEVAALDDLAALAPVLARARERESRLRSLLAGDWRRELLTHVEDVVTPAAPLPRAAGLELRYIEVPPSIHPEYHAWRSRTIFPAVRRHSQVESFRAYHSLLSARPGVTFLVEFSCPEDRYRAVYETDEYQDILRTAGTRYIRGGRAGLDTETFFRSGEPS
jgi:hypothetical protein